MSRDFSKQNNTSQHYLRASKGDISTLESRLSTIFEREHLLIDVVRGCDHCTNEIRKRYVNHGNRGLPIANRQSDDVNVITEETS